MGARMVAFLESLLSGLDCLDCLAEKGKPESKRHKLETPQLMSMYEDEIDSLQPRFRDESESACYVFSWLRSTSVFAPRRCDFRSRTCEVRRSC